METLVAQYKAQVAEHTLDTNLSFYEQFGYTQNLTYEFYQKANGEVYYIKHMNNDRENSHKYNLANLIQVLSENLDKNFRQKCDWRFFERPAPNNSALYIILCIQVIFLCLISFGVFRIFKEIYNKKKNEEMQKQSELLV